MTDLLKWKDSQNRKPLLLEWARQVGKTYLLKEFGKRYFKNVAYVSFQNPDKKLIELFNGSIEPKRIITMLELMLEMTISPKDTLIIFDEVQEVPRALTSLKYFYEDAPEYFIATAWSLLGVFLHQGTSFPVWKVNTLRLEPLDFEEFIIANWKEKIVEFLKKNSFETTFNEILYDLFKQYVFVWGMPEVANDWVENHNIENINSIQKEIINNYYGDFSKYADNITAVRIRQVFDSLPAQFAKENDKFLYGTIKTGARAREYELAIEWLIDAGIVKKVNNVNVWDKIPLKAYTNFSSFKLYFVDVGLFRFLANIPSDTILDKEEIFNKFNGLLTEQFVLQQLSKYELFYWTSDKIGEVDFILQFDSNIVPIEVKSGTNLKAKSLKLFREKYSPKISVKFSLKDTKLNDDLLNIALYHSFMFDNLLKSSI